MQRDTDGEDLPPLPVEIERSEPPIGSRPSRLAKGVALFVVVTVLSGSNATLWARVARLERKIDAQGTAAVDSPSPSIAQRATPKFVGLTYAQASALAEQFGFAVAFPSDENDRQPGAIVQSQSPEPGVIVPGNTAVQLLVGG